MIILEDKSIDTESNAYNTKQILDEHQFKEPILVTSAFHMIRSVDHFKNLGINVTPLSHEGFELTATAFEEFLGILSHKFFK